MSLTVGGCPGRGIHAASASDGRDLLSSRGPFPAWAEAAWRPRSASRSFGARGGDYRCIPDKPAIVFPTWTGFTFPI